MYTVAAGLNTRRVICSLKSVCGIGYIVRDTTLCKESLNFQGIPGEVGEACYSHEITVPYTQQIIIGKPALQQTDKASSHDHHDEKAGPLICVLP